MSYLHEFRPNLSPLIGATLGLSFGIAINFYMTNIFGPILIREFGWTRSQFALVGALGFVSLVAVPLAGRFTDRFGARRAAVVGFSVVPFCFLAFSFMSGNLYQFFAITLISSTLGMLTSTLVFARVVVERFERAPGMALALLASGPPVMGAVGVPAVAAIIEAEGWRVGYQVLAAASACGGLAAIILIGGKGKQAKASADPVRMDWSTFSELCQSRVFLLLLAGMFLCNLPQVLVSSQIGIMLAENGAGLKFAAEMVSVYGVATITGRLISGYALDRIAPNLVALAALGLPALGYVALASPYDAKWILAGSIALVGLAQGAETDVGAVLAARHFHLDHFSFVIGMLMTSMGLASALGSLVLSYVLYRTENFFIFLLLSAVATLAGALCFYLGGGTGKYISGTPTAKEEDQLTAESSAGKSGMTPVG